MFSTPPPKKVKQTPSVASSTGKKENASELSSSAAGKVAELKGFLQDTEEEGSESASDEGIFFWGWREWRWSFERRSAGRWQRGKQQRRRGEGWPEDRRWGEENEDMEPEASESEEEDSEEDEQKEEEKVEPEAHALVEVTEASKQRNSPLVLVGGNSLFWVSGCKVTKPFLTIGVLLFLISNHQVSMTNKKDWDSFVRSKGRFKVHDFYQSNRIDCFNSGWTMTRIGIRFP